MLMTVNKKWVAIYIAVYDYMFCVVLPWIGITKCLQERCWVNETPFEVQGVTVGESTMITQAPRKGRENMIRKVLLY